MDSRRCVRDKIRDEIIEMVGWKVIRFKNKKIDNKIGISLLNHLYSKVKNEFQS
ncbi:MAG: DUF559 domain-containing protein [Bacteroidetes bacterium]|nr:DUF559 domain-containing protein [Bacteroidota bacterium]